MIMAYGLVRDGLPSGLQFSIGYLKWFEYQGIIQAQIIWYKLIEFSIVPAKPWTEVDIALFCNIFQQLCNKVSQALLPANTCSGLVAQDDVISSHTI